MGLDWIIGGVGAAIIAAAVAFFGGKQSGRAQERDKAAKRNMDTEKEVGDAVRNSRLGGNDWRERLSKTGRK